MEFLANYSEFLKREKISIKQQRALQKSFAQAQNNFGRAYDKYVDLMAAVYTPNPRRTKAQAQEAERLLEQYLETGFRLSVLVAEQPVKSSVNQMFGGSKVTKLKAERFFREVWPGIRTFGFAEPMQPRK
jgi:hypothetical protein